MQPPIARLVEEGLFDGYRSGCKGRGVVKLNKARLLPAGVKPADASRNYSLRGCLARAFTCRERGRAPACAAPAAGSPCCARTLALIACCRRVLDVGCCIGDNTLHVAAHAKGARVTGCDLVSCPSEECKGPGMYLLLCRADAKPTWAYNMRTLCVHGICPHRGSRQCSRTVQLASRRAVTDE